MKRLSLVLALALPGLAGLSTLGLGCVGSIGEGETGAPGKAGNETPARPPGDPNLPPGSPPSQPNTNTPPSSDPSAPPSAEVTCGQGGKDTIGRRTLRRLTNAELEATIRGTFGLDTKQWAGLTVPPDRGSADGFNNNVDSLKVSTEYAAGTADGARRIATLVTSTPILATMLPCSSTGGAACANTFLDGIGAKLYRRPLSAAEKSRFMALFDKISKQSDFKGFVYWATTAMLQSPNLIYRSELGDPDGAGRFKLTPYEVASELAYNYTGEPPTAQLLSLAAANKLSTPDEIEAAARGLMTDGATIRPAFRETFLKFSAQWLGVSGLSNLQKDKTAFADFNDQIQSAFEEETRQFLSTVVLDDRASVEKLFTAPFTMVDPLLAKFYGFPAGAGPGFTKVTRPPEWGVGLLAQGSILAVKAHSLKTSPTKRGHLVRTNVMCGVIPPPPAMVAELPEPTEGETTRQRYESLHAGVAACSACHLRMDPIGFAFEHLDAVGRYRAKEGRFDIDDTGVLTDTSKGDLKFSGATNLAATLSTLPEVSDCFGSFLAAYSFGVSQSNSSCLVRSLVGGLKTGKSILDVYLQLSRADHVRFRQP